MNRHSRDKSSTTSSIIYWSIYLPILACAAVSIPFYNQKYRSEQSKLQTAIQKNQNEIMAKEKEISNLKMRLLFFSGESIKQYAEKMGLHAPGDGQLVAVDSFGQDVTASFLRRHKTNAMATVRYPEQPVAAAPQEPVKEIPR